MLRRLGVAVVILGLLAAACSHNQTPAEKTAEKRQTQARDAARKAGLSPAAQDFLAQYATAADNSYSVTYAPSAAGATIVLAQAPPLRRVDVVAGNETRSVFVTKQGTYECALQDKQWTCQQAQQQQAAPGVLAPADIDRFIAELKTAGTNYTFSVTHRKVANTDARCLITKPRPGVAGPGSTLCLSSKGAVLLVEGTSNPLRATKYSTSVDTRRLQLPTAPEPPPIKP